MENFFHRSILRWLYSQYESGVYSNTAYLTDFMPSGFWGVWGGFCLNLQTLKKYLISQSFKNIFIF